MENFIPSSMVAHNIGYLALNDILSNTPSDKHENFYAFDIIIFNQKYTYQFTLLDGKWLIDYNKVNYEQ